MHVQTYIRRLHGGGKQLNSVRMRRQISQLCTHWKNGTKVHKLEYKMYITLEACKYVMSFNNNTLLL